MRHLVFFLTFFGVYAFHKVSAQVTENKDVYTFKQGWRAKKSYIFEADLKIDNLYGKQSKPLFKMNTGFKLETLKYEKDLLTAKVETVHTGKIKTVKLNTKTGTLIGGQTPVALLLASGAWPTKPVRINESWTRTSSDIGNLKAFFEEKSLSVTYTFMGKANLGKDLCAKIKVDVNKGLASNVQGNGIGYIRIKDGLLTQLDIQIRQHLKNKTSAGVTDRKMELHLKRKK